MFDSVDFIIENRAYTENARNDSETLFLKVSK